MLDKNFPGFWETFSSPFCHAVDRIHFISLHRENSAMNFFSSSCSATKEELFSNNGKTTTAREKFL